MNVSLFSQSKLFTIAYLIIIRKYQEKERKRYKRAEFIAKEKRKSRTQKSEDVTHLTTMTRIAFVYKEKFLLPFL